jgi:hypothetical protein
LWFALVVAATTDISPALGLAPLVVAAMLASPAPALWALAVWHGELPHGRSYHWSLPVSRCSHDLARVAAGAVWLVASYATLAVAGALVAAGAGGWGSLVAIGSDWLPVFAGPLVVYLLIAPFAMWSDSIALRRILAGFLVFGVLAVVFDLRWHLRAAAAVFGEQSGLATALFAKRPEYDAQLAPTLLWLAIGALLTVAAATWRPGEPTKLFRREIAHLSARRARRGAGRRRLNERVAR